MNTTSESYLDSCQVYIHSLRSINELQFIYEVSHEIKYLYKKEYIENWIEFTCNNKGSNMVWYDHPTATKIQVIICYIYLEKDNHDIYETIFINILKYYSEFFTDNTN